MEDTCATKRLPATGGGGGGEIMLFGVRVVVDSMRKCVSLNDLSQYEQPQDLLPRRKKMKKDDNGGRVDEKNKAKDDMEDGGYASAEDAVPSSSGGNRGRKRGIPWTEEEHKLFLLGLQKVGKGDWRGISRNFVKTRTPTQVASHAQKYFLRRINLNRRRRRSSLFDITTDSVADYPIQYLNLGQAAQPSGLQTEFVPPVPFAVQSPTLSDVKLSSKPSMDQSPVSLNLSLSSNQTFQAITDFKDGDNDSSVISVA